MQATDFARFNAVMNGMAKLFDRELDNVLLDVYWLALRDWDLPDFEQAAGHLMASAKFMPKPSEFNDLRKASRPVAAEAWLTARKVWKSAAALGRGKVSSGDPVIDRAIEALGGYGAMAMSETSKLHFLEKQFAEIYASMQDAQDVREALPQLGGGFGLAAIQQRRAQRQIENKPAPEGV